MTWKINKKKKENSRKIVKDCENKYKYFEEKTCQTRFVYMSKIQGIEVSKLTLNCLLEARNDLQLFVVPE